VKPAVDMTDRRMAATAWAGWACGGPVVPGAVLAMSWSKRESLARRHALAAVAMWAVALAVWLPVFVFGVALRSDDPAPATVITAVALGVVTLAASIVGVTLALLAPVRGVLVS